MKNTIIGAIVAAVILVVATSEPVKALSQPVRVLKNGAVICGSTATLIAPASGASSVCIQNTSATVATIGGSGVTPTTGLAIGDGAAGGKVFCGDMAQAWCSSAGGAVTVQVIYGSN